MNSDDEQAPTSISWRKPTQDENEYDDEIPDEGHAKMARVCRNMFILVTGGDPELWDKNQNLTASVESEAMIMTNHPSVRACSMKDKICYKQCPEQLKERSPKGWEEKKNGDSQATLIGVLEIASPVTRVGLVYTDSTVTGEGIVMVGGRW